MDLVQRADYPIEFPRESSSGNGIEAILAKLNPKLSISNLLTIKAEAQGLTLVETNDADEVYTMQWAINTANVTKLLVD